MPAGTSPHSIPGGAGEPRLREDHVFDRIASLASRFQGLLVVGVLVASQGTAAAITPLQTHHSVDNTFRLGPASTLCGFDIYGHFEGDFTYKVFYDRNGLIVREIDTFTSFKVTIFAPSTGKSYTSASPASLHATYTTPGAPIGSMVVVSETGLLEKFSDVDMVSGRRLFNARVVGYDEDGVPLFQFVSEISSSGPALDSTFGAARCAAMR